jgi:hypothetical protein
MAPRRIAILDSGINSRRRRDQHELAIAQRLRPECVFEDVLDTGLNQVRDALNYAAWQPE